MASGHKIKKCINALHYANPSTAQIGKYCHQSEVVETILLRDHGEALRAWFRSARGGEENKAEP